MTLTTAVEIRADPMVVTEGGASFDFHTPPGFSVKGDGFYVTGFPAGIGVTSVLKCNFPSSCPPGTTIDLTTVFVGLGAGGATLNGTAYGTHRQSGEGEPIILNGTLAFTAPAVTVPADPAGTAELFERFTFRGQVAGEDPQTAQKLFDMSLRGQGRVLLRLGGSPGGLHPSGPYQFLSIGYAFEPAQPVPEPGTILLFSNGVVAFLGARRFLRRRRI
jgi:hypothetical protein